MEKKGFEARTKEWRCDEWRYPVVAGMPANPTRWSGHQTGAFLTLAQHSVIYHMACCINQKRSPVSRS